MYVHSAAWKMEPSGNAPTDFEDPGIWATVMGLYEHSMVCLGRSDSHFMRSRKSCGQKRGGGLDMEGGGLDMEGGGVRNGGRGSCGA